MTNTRIGAYVGVDPTASSIHVGNLLPFMVLFWLYIHGYHAVALVSWLPFSIRRGRRGRNFFVNFLQSKEL